MTAENGLKILARAVEEIRDRSGKIALILDAEQFKSWFSLLLKGPSALEGTDLKMAPSKFPLSVKSCNSLEIAIAGGPRPMARIEAKGLIVSIGPIDKGFEELSLTIKNSRTAGKIEAVPDSIKVIPPTIDLLVTQVNVVDIIKEKIGGEKITDGLREVLAEQLDANGAALNSMTIELTREGKVAVRLSGSRKY